MKILIPAETATKPEIDDVEYVEYSDLTVPEQHRDAEVLVVWGGASEKLSALINSLPNLKFIQAFAAGPDSLLAAGIPEGVKVATGRGLHDRTVSEHAISLILQLTSCAPQLAQAQREHHWAGEYGNPRPLQFADRVSSIIDANILIWGFGSIGQYLAGLLKQLGAASVRGVARSGGQRAGFDVITEESLDEALTQTDILVMVLPQSASTEKALNAQRLAKLPKRAIVVNVGRGRTVDEQALVDALNNEKIYGAAIDVAYSEPLSADSELWEARNLIITPHIAGFRADGGQQLLAENIANLRAGKKLRNEVEL